MRDIASKDKFVVIKVCELRKIVCLDLPLYFASTSLATQG